MSNSERLVYLALGGAGEIGMNMYLYGWGKPGQERWIMVDVGVTFPNMESSPGVDLIFPDTTFIEERLEQLEAIFITHAHEDHIGGLGYLWDRIGGCPVYTRTFTGIVAKHKLEGSGIEPSMLEVVDTFPDMVEAGPFKVGFMPVSHSIPEASAIVIDTPAGRVLHTGDLKLDATPLLGEPFDPSAFEEVSKDGLLALVCDSTNVFSTVPGRSEADLVAEVEALMKDATGMVVATTFASNIARLRTLARAAANQGRAVVLLGRAMNRMLGFGREAGIIDDFPNVVSPEDAASIPREHLFALSTGSQGEPRAATASLARDKYLGIELREGDTFLFSSKTIPGNEVGVGRLVNGLAEKGVRVVEEDPRYHVSGHANRPDLLRVHELTNPQMVVPMHGEYRHLKVHADLAAENGRKSAIAPNGVMIDLSHDQGAVLDHIETGRTYLDGTVLIGAMDGVVRERLRMAWRGSVAVSVVIDEDNQPLDGVWAEPSGVPDPKVGSLQELIEEAIENHLATTKRRDLADDAKVEELVSRVVRKVCKDEVGKKPQVTVLINRLA